MERLPNETLDNAISVYETTMRVTGDNGEPCYLPIDEVTLCFLKELKACRDAEKQGLLFQLPCRVGDTAYYVHRKYLANIDKWINCMEEVEVESFILNVNLFVNVIQRIGSNSFGKTLAPYKTLFFTKEEAEQKLAEMKGE